MVEISSDQAVKRLTEQIKGNLDPEDLLEVYNELFDEDPYTAEEAHDDPDQISEQLVDHLKGGLEPEEIVQMWNLVFPRDRNVWYNEEVERFNFNEEAEPQTAG